MGRGRTCTRGALVRKTRRVDEGDDGTEEEKQRERKENRNETNEVEKRLIGEKWDLPQNFTKEKFRRPQKKNPKNPSQ